MGQVYLGRSPGGRPVAVKTVLPELVRNDDARRRFAREIAAARRVNGAFTAGVVDSDPDGSPAWLATVYVPGVSLGEAVDGHGPWPAAHVLALAAGLTEALEAIHAEGIVHRDLKPSNVLLAADGPRVIDFGISLASEASVLTQTGVTPGTPGFMSPEQVNDQAVGPPSDIFALGAVLTYAATGRGPFGSGHAGAVCYRTVKESPNLEALPASLHQMVALCLAKRPDDRPTTADLLEQLINASPDRHSEVTPTGLLSGSSWMPAQAAALVDAHAAATPPPTPPSVASSSRAPLRTNTGPAVQTSQGGREAPSLLHRPSMLRYRMPGRPIHCHQRGVTRMAFSPDGSLLCTVGHDGIRLLDPVTHQVGEPFPGTAVAFSAEGSVMAVAGNDGRIRFWHSSTQQPAGELSTDTAIQSMAMSHDGSLLATTGKHEIWLWDVASGRLVSNLPINRPTVQAAFSPDGTLLAVTDGNAEQVWDVSACQRVDVPYDDRGGMRPRRAAAVAFTPDGVLVTTARTDFTALSEVSEQWRQTIEGFSVNVEAAFSPDGALLATVTEDAMARIWNPVTRQLISQPVLVPTSLSQNHVMAVAVSSDGAFLAVGKSNGRVALFEAVDIAKSAASPSPMAASASAEPVPLSRLAYESGPVQTVALSPDGTLLAASGARPRPAVREDGSGEGPVQLWNLMNGQPLRQFDGQSPRGTRKRIRTVTFSPDGGFIAVANSYKSTIFELAPPSGYEWAIDIWQASLGQSPHHLALNQRFQSSLSAVALSPDRIHLATDIDGRLKVWNMTTGESVWDHYIGADDSTRAATFSPDGKTLATAGPYGVALWDALSDRSSGDVLASHTDGMHAVAFSPDSSHLAAASADGTVQRLHVASGRVVSVHRIEHTSTAMALAFLPDGTLRAAGANHTTIRCWIIP